MVFVCYKYYTNVNSREMNAGRHHDHSLGFFNKLFVDMNFTNAI